jgi:hypothetical protein
VRRGPEGRDVWPGKIVAQRDPEQYTRAIDYLSDLCTDWRGMDYEEKEIVVLVPR